MQTPVDVQLLGKEPELYTRRFSETQDKARATTWKILCRDFFQKYIPENALVVDIGAGDGNFSKNIKAGRRVAVDISPHASVLEEFGIEVVLSPATEFAKLLDAKADVVFMSNFLEHLPNKKTLFEVLEECRKALKPGGQILILQPNIRHVGFAYWDYIDHHIALTEVSLVEALEVSGFKVERVIDRFLPYTAKSRLGDFAALTGWYLKMPFFWRFFGKQTFVAAKAVE